MCLYALARTTQKHPEYQGPQMGPKMATKNERNFSDEQIRQGRDGQIGLQVPFFLLLIIEFLRASARARESMELCLDFFMTVFSNV